MECEITIDLPNGCCITDIMEYGETEEDVRRRHMTQDERDMYDAMKEVDEFLEANK